MMEQRPSRPPRLRLRITAAAESAVRQGHPWVYENSVLNQNRPGNPGEYAVIFDRSDRFLAIGLFDPDSPLRVRILHVGKPIALDDLWWLNHLRKAIQRREGVGDSETTGYRIIHGENDGWPGFVLDRYGSVLVLKLYTGVWLPRLAELVPRIVAELAPERIVLRLSRNLQDVAGRQGFQDGANLFGSSTDERVIFKENGLRFEAEVVRGQKTGFFLDQRENRKEVGQLSSSAEVLNAFSFSAGFSLYAARGGALRVVDLDISPHALDSGTRNFNLNANIPSVQNCLREAVQADVFAWLRTSPQRRFDVVILDPPSLAKRESERASAIQAYERLAVDGLKRVRPRGWLLAASCSAHVSADEFFATVRAATQGSPLRFHEVRTAEHPADHPATFTEGRYLKAIYLRASL